MIHWKVRKLNKMWVLTTAESREKIDLSTLVVSAAVRSKAVVHSLIVDS